MSKKKQRPIVEALEPRILYSADPIGALFDLPADDFTDNNTSSLLDSLKAPPTPQSDAPASDIVDNAGTIDFDTSFSPKRTEGRLELVFVDTGTPDYQQLLDDLLSQSDEARSFEVTVIDAQANGVDIISETLINYRDIDAVHIISHGSNGSLELGSTTLDAQYLESHANQFSQWATTFSEAGDILFYGCNFASDDTGKELIESIAALTDADVAASDNLTGHVSLGGNWELEHYSGDIETSIAISDDAQQAWEGSLDITTGLVGHWTFDSNADDSSANASHGVLSDNAVVDTTPVSNQMGAGKLLLDGDNDHVDLSAHVSNYSNLNEGTISGWVNFTGTGLHSIFTISDAGDPSSFATLAVDNGKLFFRIDEAGFGLVDVDASTLVNDGNWHHVAVTVDGTGNKLFVDGVQATGTDLNYLVGSASTSAFFDDMTNLDAMHIGTRDSVDPLLWDFDGLIDDHRLYSRALSSSDVFELYNADNNNDAPRFEPLPPTFTENTITGPGATISDMTVVDLDGDGDMDIISVSDAAGTVAWHENDGNETFTIHTINTNTKVGVVSVTVVDLDGDGDLDVLSASQNDDTIAWYENNGSEGFTEHTITNLADGASSVAVADMDGDGDLDVLSTSEQDDSIDWYRNDGNENFTVINISSANGPTSVTTADLDGDGDQDVLVAVYHDDTVVWYKNDGSGNFTTTHVIADITTTIDGLTITDGVYSVTTADLDGDGDLDVLSTSEYDDNVAWYENDGSGNFTIHTITTTADGARSVAVADMDGDGDLDVLSASIWDGAVNWYQNDGNHNFTPYNINTGALGDAYFVTTADLDSDGDIDVLSSSLLTDVIIWHENTSSGATLDGMPSFTEGGAAVVLDADVGISDAELDVLNGGNGGNGGNGDYDGASVTLVRNASVSTEDIFSFNDSNGITLVGGNLIKNSQIIGTFDTTTTPGQLLISFTNANGEIPTSADVDNILQQITYANSSDAPPASAQIDWTFNDGNSGAQGTGGALDVTGSTTVSITAVNDAPTASNNTVTTNKDTTYTFTAAEFNYSDPEGDTLASIQITTLETVGALQLSGVDVTLHQIITEAYIDAGNLKFVPVADANGSGYDSFAFSVNDGTTDSASSYTQTIDVTAVNEAPVFGSDLPPTFTPHTVTAAAGNAKSVSSADIDGDGDIDVLSTSFASNTVAWHENDGSGNFTAHTITTTANGATSVSTADIDGDGDMDVLSASRDDDTVAWYENDGSGNFTTHTITTTANGAKSVSTADVDGDGDMDILSASGDDDTIAWYENDGSENFTTHIVTTTAIGAKSVSTADVDGDGDMDILSASSDDDTIAWYENDGSENFTTHVITTTADGATSVSTADLDGDGDVDVLSTSYADNTVAWYENDGNENFTTHVITTTADGALFVSTADIDGDGDIDVLSASKNGDNIVWYENTGVGSLDGSAAFIEDGPAVTLDSNVTLVDSELDALNTGSGDYNGASLTLVRNGGVSTEDTFSFNDGNGITLVGGNLIKNSQIIGTFDTTTTPGQLLISFTNANGEIPTSADVDNILKQITYANSSDTPLATAQIDWTFDDGDASGALQATGSTTVSITAVNDASVVDNASLTLNEGQTVTLSGANFGSTDPDDTALTYTLSGITGGYFHLSNNAGVAITTFNSADLSGSLVQFVDNGDETAPAFSVTVNDGDVDSNTLAATVNFTVTDNNLSPINSVPGAQSTNEDTTLTFNTVNSNLILITDEANTNLIVTIAANNGQLTLSGAVGLTLESGAYGSSTMTVSGTVEAINTALDGLQYAPDTNYSGADSLTITTTDSTIYQLNIDTNLQGFYEFTSGSVTVDSSPVGSNGGTLNGDATVINDAQHGDVISFDGTGDAIQITDMFSEPSDITLAAWVNVNAGATGDIISLGDNVGITVNQFGNSVSGLFYNGSSWVYTTDSIAIDGDGWHHIAYAFDDINNTQTLYIDGVATATTNDSNSISYSNGSNTFIGTDGNGNGYDITGLIDDVRIYDQVLTSGEIANLASAPLVPTDTDNITITVSAINDAPTFDAGDGVVTTSIGSADDWARAMVLQDHGKIIVVGYEFNGSDNDFTLVRYNVDGSLDTTFGTDGKVSTVFGSGDDKAYAVTVQSDGKILVAGHSLIAGSIDFAVARYNTDGSLDTSFSSDGKATVNFASSIDYAESITVQTDGKILVAGMGDNQYGVVRFNSDGTLDSSFGSGGKVTADVDADASGQDYAYAIDLQDDGKIILAGYSSNSDFAIVRYNTDGSLDTGFGTSGQVTTDFASGLDVAKSLIIQSDGKILVGGYANNGSNLDYALARYNADGSLDTSFSADGKLLTNFGNNDISTSMVQQTDGKVILAGYNGSGDLTLVRYDTNGDIDATFGTTGVVTEFVGTDLYVQDVAIRSDGGIVVAATSTLPDKDFAVLSFQSDGSLDERFGLVNTLDGTPTFTENGAAVVLDADVQIFDAELNAADNYSGSTLTLVRNGAASAEDIFSATANLSALTESGNLILSGVSIGTVTTNSAGTLVLTFNASATQAYVNETLQSIAYTNSSDAPPASAQINWAFNDGNSGAQGSGGALQAVGSATVNITAVNDVPVATGNTVIAIEDVPLVIGSSDFNFSDVESDVLVSVTITGLTLNGGSLTHSAGSVTVTNGMTDTAAELADLTFTSASNDFTDSSFTYTVNDAGVGVTSAVMNITVNAVNDVPVATGNTVVASEDVPLVIGAGDFSFTDIESDALTSVTITGLTLNGGTLTHSAGAVTVTNGMTVTAAQLADLTFTSASNDSTNSSFTYTVNDSNAGVTSAVINITVNAVNDVPVSTGNTVVANEDVPLVIGAGDFSFTDVESDALASVTITGLTLNGGTLTHSAGAVTVTNGMTITAAELADLTFTSALNDSTDSSFTYTVNDADTGVTSAVMNITVNAVNDVPVATGNTVVASEDVPLVIDASDFSFTDVESDALTSVTLTGLSLNGSTLTHSAGAVTVTNGMTVTAAQLADLTFTSASNDSTDSSFTYTVNDADAGVTSAVMNITVNPVNDVPVATGNTVVASEDVPLVIDASDFNFSDTEGDSLASVTVTGLSLNGGTLTHSAGATTVTNGMTVTAAQLADLTFTSALNDSTDSSFTYTVNDAGVGVTSAVMNITVNAVNDVPVATGNTVVASEDVPLVIGPTDFNFTDVEGDTLASVTVTGLTLNGGTLTHSAGAVIVTNGMTITAAQLADLTFTSALNDSTNSSFTYTVNDAGAGVTAAVMNITVNSINDVPVATGNTVLAIEDVPLLIDAGEFLYTDIESDALQSVTITGLNLNGGTLTHSAGAVSVTNGMTVTAAQLVDLTFNPALNSSLPVSFDYSVNDADNGMIAATMHITGIPVNDAPVIVSNGGGDNAAVQTVENYDQVLTVVATDIDSGDTIAYGIDGGSDAGLFSIDSNTGELHFANAPNFEAPQDANQNNLYDVEVTASDGNGGVDRQALSITVLNENESPADLSLSNERIDAYIDTVGGFMIGQLSAADEDFGDTLSFSLVGGADVALFSLAGADAGTLMIDDGVINDNKQSAYELVVRATDAEGASVDRAFNITVTPREIITLPITEGPKTPPVVTPVVDPFEESTESILVHEEVEPLETGTPKESSSNQPSSVDIRLESMAIDELVRVASELNTQSNQESEFSTGEESMIPLKHLDLANLNLMPLGTLNIPTTAALSVFENEFFTESLQRMSRDMENAFEEEEKQHRLIAEISSGVTLSLTAGFISWMLQSGSLLASLLSAAPVWKKIDPLLILAASKRKAEQIPGETEEEKRVAEMFN